MGSTLSNRIYLSKRKKLVTTQRYGELGNMHYMNEYGLDYLYFSTYNFKPKYGEYELSNGFQAFQPTLL